MTIESEIQEAATSAVETLTCFSGDGAAKYAGGIIDGMRAAGRSIADVDDVVRAVVDALAVMRLRHGELAL